MAAPSAPILGIRIKFKIALIIAEVNVLIASIPFLFTAVKVEAKKLLNPLNTIAKTRVGVYLQASKKSFEYINLDKGIFSKIKMEQQITNPTLYISYVLVKKPSSSSFLYSLIADKLHACVKTAQSAVIIVGIL